MDEDAPFSFLDGLFGVLVGEHVHLEDEKAHVGALVIPFLDELSGYVDRVAGEHGSREPPVLKPHEGDRREPRHGEPQARGYRGDQHPVGDARLEHGVFRELLVYVHVVVVRGKSREVDHVGFGDRSSGAFVLGSLFQVFVKDSRHLVLLAVKRRV